MKISTKLPKPDYLSANQERVFIHYTAPLTTVEKTILDSLMADTKIGSYPSSSSGYTVLLVDDLYDAWKKIETQTGIKIDFIFPNIPDRSKLEVWIQGTLTSTQLKKLKDAYSSLFLGVKP